MATQYTINLVNNGTSTETFWCFLSAPVEKIDSKVFGNSSANLTIEAEAGSNSNQFIIPLQYVVAAGASNQAVGLNTKVISSAHHNTEIGAQWNATYHPANQGPDLKPALAPSVTGNTISIVNNGFDPRANAGNEWYESQTFGIQSSNGFIGLTWAPQPNDTSVITPLFTFYVATGRYSASALADIDTFSNTPAKIMQTDFAVDNQVWVTREVTGSWTVSAVAPALK